MQTIEITPGKYKLRTGRIVEVVKEPMHLDLATDPIQIGLELAQRMWDSQGNAKNSTWDIIERLRPSVW